MKKQIKNPKISETSSDEDFHNAACAILRRVDNPETGRGISGCIAILSWYEAGREFRKRTVKKGSPSKAKRNGS
jgi:hypothetical protein